MAEDVVLARLSVDPTGVVSGIGMSDQAMLRGEKSLKMFGSTSQLVAARLANFRGALLMLARSFGVIGVITTLAFALKSLITQVITSSRWFAQAAENVTNWWKALVEGERAVDRMARTLGKGDVTGKLAEFNRLMKERQEILSKLAGPVPPKNQIVSGMATGGLLGGLAGLTSLLPQPGEDKTSPAVTSAMRAEVEALTQRIEILGRELHEKGVIGLEAFGKITGSVKLTREEIDKLMQEGLALFASWKGNKGLLPEAPPPSALAGDALFALMGLPPPEMAFAAFDEVDAAVQALRDNLDFFSESQVTVGVEGLVSLYNRLGLSAEEARARINALGLEVAELPTVWDEFKAGLEASMTTASLAVDLVSTSINQFAASMTKAFTSGNFSFKKFFAEMLMAMVPVLLGYAAMGLVIGFLFKDPGAFVAAGLAFAGAAAAAAAARALGGGGGRESSGSGGGRGGGGGGGGGGEVAAGGGQTVTVNILGSLIGTDADSLARDLSRLIATAKTDGSR